MNFVCQRDKLSEAVNVVSKAASVKSTITALEGIKAEVKDGKIKMSAYDFNVAISAVFDANTVENGTIIFPAKLFSDIVRKLPGGEDVYIEADDGYQIKISCGGTVFNIWVFRRRIFRRFRLFLTKIVWSLQYPLLKGL